MFVRRPAAISPPPIFFAAHFLPAVSNIPLLFAPCSARPDKLGMGVTPLACCRCGLDGAWPARLQHRVWICRSKYRAEQGKPRKRENVVARDVRCAMARPQPSVHYARAAGRYPPSGRHLLGPQSSTPCARALGLYPPPGRHHPQEPARQEAYHHKGTLSKADM